MGPLVNWDAIRLGKPRSESGACFAISSCFRRSSLNCFAFSVAIAPFVWLLALVN